ncbi:hypothetical protein HY478_00405 [Candidatus Uhrbacteria bacterium]|nr:hypothetical protein [Candidatus Uhrbacteria bacterium]
MKGTWSLSAFLAVFGALLIVSDVHAIGWVAQTSGLPAFTSLNDVQIHGSTVYAVGESGTILKTTDEGQSWISKADPDVSSMLHAIDTYGSNIWVVGYNVRMKSTNGGDSWDVATGAGPFFSTNYDVDFVNSSTGWRVGSSLGIGFISKSTDGGSSWTSQTIPDGTPSLRDIHCVNTSTCWAVGDEGTILKTSNGGSTWTAQTSGTTNLLYDVYFNFAGTMGWVVGGDGVIRRTTNGTTWANPIVGGGVLPGTPHLTDIDFVGDSTGWVVGAEPAAIFKTVDGGVNWVSEIPGTPWDLIAVDFSTTITGWAVGGNGVIRRYDATPPSAPGGLTKTSLDSDNTPMFTWTASTDNTGVVRYEYSIDDEPWIDVGLSLTATVGPALEDGAAHFIVVRAIDGGGNISANATTGFVVDTTLPTTPTGVVRTSPSTDTTPTFTWTPSTDNIAMGEYRANILSGGGGLIGIAEESTGLVASYTLSDATPLAPGTYTFWVWAWDAAGNRSDDPGYLLFMVDAPAPGDVVPPTAPGALTRTSLDSDNTPTFSWIASTDNVAVTNYEVQVDGGAFMSNGLLLAYTSGALIDGSHIVGVRARDAAGNSSGTSSLSFSISTGVVPPAVEPPTPPGLLPAGFLIGDRVKLADDGNPLTFGDTAVFYLGADGGRYVFTNDKSYRTWYANFNGVKTISVVDIASIPLRGNVTYRPGVKMVKLQTSPTVYAVVRGGVLRAVPSEAVATALYGATWNSQIDDVNDAFWTNYTIGIPLTGYADDYNPGAESTATPTINIDKGL